MGGVVPNTPSGGRELEHFTTVEADRPIIKVPICRSRAGSSGTFKEEYDSKERICEVFLYFNPLGENICLEYLYWNYIKHWAVVFQYNNRTILYWKTNTAPADDKKGNERAVHVEIANLSWEALAKQSEYFPSEKDKYKRTRKGWQLTLPKEFI